jgi:glycosyltransferase involved in cell wall biosynthesis
MAMKSKRLTMSVVICAYNEQDWILRTLDSLLRQQRLPETIVVVDNASTDHTNTRVQSFIEAHPEQRFKLITEAQKGLHFAREAGWRATDTDIVVMTDADITFPSDWLHIIERSFNDDPDLSALTGIIRFDDAPAFINWATAGTDQFFQPQGIGKWLNSLYILNGGNSAYRRHVLEAVNGYADKPRDMLEDRYLSQRIQERGYKVRLVMQNKVWHTFRRFQKDGWRGYWKYLFDYTAESVYADHLTDGYDKTITVIVPAYNEEKLIVRCLDSLAAQDPVPDEILVVDNASKDRTAEMVKQFIAAHPTLNTRMIYETKQGCHHARETGWRESIGAIIIHVDADEIMPPGWLARIRATLMLNPKLDVIGGTVRFENPPFSIWLMQVLFNLLYPRLVQLSKGFPYICGGMTIAKREVLEKMNGYINKPDDELDDYYLSKQAHQLGYTLRYIPAIYGIHSLRRYEAGGLRGWLQWGVSGLDAQKYDADVR